MTRRLNKKEDGLAPLDVHIGMRVRQRRQLLGLTQQDVAEKIKVRYQQIQKYERGVNRISASTLHDIAEVLNIPVSFFYEEYDSDVEPGTSNYDYAKGFAEDGQVPFEGDDPLLRRETMNLIRSYYSIRDEKQRKKIYELIRSLAEEENSQKDTQ